MESNIKIIEKYGKDNGKNLVVLVGVHGNEFCGVKAVESLLSNLNIKSGKVRFIYANIKAINQNKRFIEQNLNRCFLKDLPKDIEWSLEGRTAQEILPFLDDSDAMLDVHASLTKGSVPFVICDESNLDNANKIFNAEKLLCNLDYFHPGSTDGYMNLQKKQGFCFECGYVNDFKTIEIAKEAIEDFLIYFGSLLEKNEKLKIKRKRINKLKTVGIYKNRYGPFKVARFFKDFEKIKVRTLIGTDGDREVYVDEGKAVLFVRNREKINEECFLVCEEI